MTERDPAQSPEALERLRQSYLIESAISQSLRAIYGDKAVHENKRISKALANELLKRGVVFLPPKIIHSEGANSA
jgi:hypothetical protein